MMMKCIATLIASTLVGISTTRSIAISATTTPNTAERPNILFIVLDDIGIDAITIAPFGWNEAPLAPDLPVLQAIANDSLSFTNFWATPECSPSRACFMTGRWGHRTGVTTAIVDPMLPLNQLNPAEVTLPEIMGEQGYEVAMFGKYHLAASPPNTPAGNGYEAPFTSSKLDLYEGYWSLPPSIDRTVGGQVEDGDLSNTPCGYPRGFPNVTGAACFPTGSCEDGDLVWGDCMEDVAPLDALAMGGLPLVDASGQLITSCDTDACALIDLCDEDTGAYIADHFNAYYAWGRVQTDEDGFEPAEYPANDPTRIYLTDWISDRSAEWISERNTMRTPWMCMVTHSAAHTPIQTPPDGNADLNCTLPTLDPNVEFREVYSEMIENVDSSIGRMLVELGYGHVTDDGFELADLAAENVMLVIMSDNGSLGYTVFPPFSPFEAKQTVYQTGVWVPCMVAGAGVNVTPGSLATVDAQVNVVDLFSLFCEVGGADPDAVVEAKSPGRLLDARPMLPYLEDPGREPIRVFDVALYQSGMYPAEPGTPQSDEGGIGGACSLSGLIIDQLFSNETFCADNGGEWLGGDDPGNPLGYCELYEIWQSDPCNDALVDPDGNRYSFANPYGSPQDTCDAPPACDDGRPIVCARAPLRGQWGVRKGRWKLVVSQHPDCQSSADDAPETEACQLEFYHLNEPDPPSVPGIESSVVMLDLDKLTPAESIILKELKAELREVLESEAYCPGDGNMDLRVDMLDLQAAISDWGGPSFWDVDRDGRITGADIGLIVANWTDDCTGNIAPPGATPLNDPSYIPTCLTD